MSGTEAVACRNFLGGVLHFTNYKKYYPFIIKHLKNRSQQNKDCNTIPYK